VGSGSESRNVFTRDVSSRTSTTVASCHGPTRGTSVTLVALFGPRIATIVVAAFFQKPGSSWSMRRNPATHLALFQK